MLIENFEQYVKDYDVSRETLERLEKFVSLLQERNKNLSLVAKSTLPDIWMRHVVDSAQLLKYVSKDSVIYDFGSGAGFPGIILSYLGVEKVHLVESDGRKVEFLKEAAKISNNEIEIHYKRIESLSIDNCDVITARAVAPLVNMLKIIKKVAPIDARILLFKGRNIDQEIIDACKIYKFDYDLYPSIVAKDSSIIEIRSLKTS